MLACRDCKSVDHASSGRTTDLRPYQSDFRWPIALGRRRWGKNISFNQTCKIIVVSDVNLAVTFTRGKTIQTHICGSLVGRKTSFFLVEAG